jgi:hypothetical protein
MFLRKKQSKVRFKKGLPKIVKRTIFASIILVVLAVIGGMIYVYIGDKSTPEPATFVTPIEQAPLPKETPPGPNAPESAAIQYLETPVAVGQNSTITVTTGPNSKCTIVVAYNNVVSKDSGLVPHTADIHGSVTWAWTLDKNAAIGKWPVKVTCVRNNKTGYVEGTLQVTK